MSTIALLVKSEPLEKLATPTSISTSPPSSSSSISSSSSSSVATDLHRSPASSSSASSSLRASPTRSDTTSGQAAPGGTPVQTPAPPPLTGGQTSAGYSPATDSGVADSPPSMFNTSSGHVQSQTNHNDIGSVFKVANLLKDTWIPEPEPRVPEVAVQQPENDLLRGILQRRAEVTGNFMDPPPSYSSKVMSWDLRATAAVPGTGAAPPRERSVGLSRPQKRKQYAPQHADNRKYAGGGDSGATTPTPASRGGAREFGAELKQFVALLHSELDTVVERAMSKMTGKLSPPEQQLLAFNNNNNMSNNMNTSINNNNMNNNITNNNITNNNNNNNTAKLNFNDTANTATSLPLTNNGETGVDSVGFPIFPPPVSSYYSTPHHQMALLALQHATARGMSGGQLTSTTKQQQEPEQTEPMSLVLSTPKKRRTKVTDTRLSPRSSRVAQEHGFLQRTPQPHPHPQHQQHHHDQMMTASSSFPLFPTVTSGTTGAFTSTSASVANGIAASPSLTERYNAISTSALLPAYLPTSVAVPNPGLHNSEIMSQLFSTPLKFDLSSSPMTSLNSPSNRISPELIDEWRQECALKPMDTSFLAYGGTRVAVSEPDLEVDLGTTADGQIITSVLTPMHLRKAKLLFFFVRYPSSAILKTFFPDVRFNKNNTAQLIKWFSNFREFFYIQVEKHARIIKEEGFQRIDDIIVHPDSEIYRNLIVHYNRNNQIEVPCHFRLTVESTLREFCTSICANKDQETSWKKSIYKLIARMDEPIPEFFKCANWVERLGELAHH